MSPTIKDVTDTKVFRGLLGDVDPIYKKVDPLDSKLCMDVWSSKYKFKNETFEGMCKRVCDAIYEHDPNKDQHDAAMHYMRAGMWMPAGRILAGAGTAKRVTLMNCFVNSTLEDDMESIADGVKNIMLTMQQGGGVGTDFSPLRPPGAILHRTGAVASGPGRFLDQWDATCDTIKSAGDRRGAMMGTLICTHPFLPEFIDAKHEKGRWTNFNVSVLVTDAFMSAVDEDEEWLLYHPVEPSYSRPFELVARDFEDDEEVTQYVYSVWQARDLWGKITLSTYHYAEPGVIFIDRVNDMNNLNYLEHIMCTNPCGEQPLPPHGCCNLGAVNVSRMVKNPFTDDAEFNWELLEATAAIGTRFLDNVIDVTNYPLKAQEAEEMFKRRIGLGVAGLADAMHMLCMRYGSPRSIKFAEEVMRRICETAYRTSAALAEERGAFPGFDADKFMQSSFVQRLPQELQDKIRKGLRNGVLLTIAPTGTTSLAYGNSSSGLEPVFMHEQGRNVTQPDGSMLAYTDRAYGARIYYALNPDATELPTYMNEHQDVKVHEHIRMQEVCQRWVDASISKTINLPKDISYEAFQEVYSMAYAADLKGCTTYRPSEVRGSILFDASSGDNGSDAGSNISGQQLQSQALVKERPEILDSKTLKLKWPSLQSALYLTVGFCSGKPFEVFLNSKDQRAMEWMTTVTLLLTMTLRAGTPFQTLADEFKQVQALEGGWAEGQYWPSLIAYLGHKIEVLLADSPRDADLTDGSTSMTNFVVQSQTVDIAGLKKNEPEMQVVQMGRPKHGCPECHSYNISMAGGCPTCQDCGWSKCA